LFAEDIDVDCTRVDKSVQSQRGAMIRGVQKSYILSIVRGSEVLDVAQNIFEKTTDIFEVVRVWYNPHGGVIVEKEAALVGKSESLTVEFADMISS
jgi:hypothetical protein